MQGQQGGPSVWAHSSSSTPPPFVQLFAPRSDKEEEEEDDKAQDDDDVDPSLSDLVATGHHPHPITLANLRDDHLIPDDLDRDKTPGHHPIPLADDATSCRQSPPPGYPVSEVSATTSPSIRPPPPFYAPPSTSSSNNHHHNLYQHHHHPSTAVVAITAVANPLIPEPDSNHDYYLPSSAAPAYAPPFTTDPGTSSFQEEAKRALPPKTKVDPSLSSSSSPTSPSTPSFLPSTSSPTFFQPPLPPLPPSQSSAPKFDQSSHHSAAKNKEEDDAEPPPAYSEGDSPLLSFTYLMAAAGGAGSIITQVQQGGPPLPINTLGDVSADETICMDLRGARFHLSREELLTLPEFVLLSLFPNGLFPEGHMNGFGEGDAVQVDYDPASLQYMLDFFRKVAQSSDAGSTISAGRRSQDGTDSLMALDPMSGRDDASRRRGIIVLREDLDFYVIPPRPDIKQAEMMEIKRAAARSLLKQDGIFSGLKKSDEPGTTEAHLIEMLTAGGFNHDDRWGHRAGEPNKAVICSLALARLRTDVRSNEMTNGTVGMAQKLLLFWRKPARRCWWEGVELSDIDLAPGGQLKVWIRRVWTLEMSMGM